MRQRVALVRDEQDRWFIRRVSYNRFDMDVNEMVYICDQHLGGPFESVQEAIEKLEEIDE